jgi:MSHA biogenesis protein MshO
MHPTIFRLPARPVRSAAKPAQSGFTLVEMVMVIVIIGVIGAAMAVFIKSPIDAYLDSARRARLTDVADTALRRMTRDIRTALPNSLRQASGSNAINNQCIEFIPTKTGGRYRAEVDATGHGDVLRFDAADSSFDMFGPNRTLPDQSIVAGDLVVIYNLGVPGADAYASLNSNVSAVTQVGAGSLPNETKIGITNLQFPLASGSNRFQIIPGNQKIVSYVCSGGNLYRHFNYAYADSCPTRGGDLIAKDANCTFVYNGSDLQRNALVQIKLALTSGGETVSLYHEVHVSNTP